MADTDFVTELQIDALVTTLATATNTKVTSSDADDIVKISQAAYDALGAGRPATRLYLITS